MVSWTWASRVVQWSRTRLPRQEMHKLGFDPRVRKIPRRWQWKHTPVLLPGKSQGQRSLVGCSPWDRQESDMTEWARTHVTHLKTCGEGRSQGECFYYKRRKRKKEKKKGHKKSLGGDEYFCSLECGNGIVGIYVCVQTPKINTLKMHDLGDFPGGPGTKASHFQSRGLGFDPWSGN